MKTGESFVKTTSGDDGVPRPGAPRLSEEDVASTPNECIGPDGKNGPVRVVVADDHDVLRQCLCRFLRERGGLDVVAQAADGQEAVARTRELLPDMVLMDVNMPHVDGIEATRQIIRDYPAVKVLAISADWHKSAVTYMLAAGASGCVSKASPSDTLLHAIRTVFTGRHYLCPEVTALVANNRTLI